VRVLKKEISTERKKDKKKELKDQQRKNKTKLQGIISITVVFFVFELNNKN
jgi:hypothetical protein